MMRSEAVEKALRQKRIKNISVIVILAAALFVMFLVSMSVGYLKMSPRDTMRVLFGGGTSKENLILFTFRLPRIVLSILVGMGLSLSGCIIQGVSRNPLADPGLLGINAGAGLTVILFVLFFGSSSITQIVSLPFMALIGAGAVALVIYVLSMKKGVGIVPVRLILTGIAVQAGISAVTTLLVIRLDESQYDFVVSWQAGSIWGSNWKFVLSLLPWIVVLFPITLFKARVLDVMTLGDENAKSLGTSAGRERAILLALSVAFAASCVSVSGAIGFVGLIAPHLARRLVGPMHRILLPTCALTGGLLVLLADSAARVILQPSELPTGIMVAIIGAPYFIYLLIKQKK